MRFKQPVNIARNANRRRTLYVIQSGEFVKVGITDDVKKRLFSLQAGNPLPLRLRMSRTMPAALALQVEAMVHRVLAEHSIGREWFRIEAAVAVKAARPILREAERAIHQWVDPDLGIITGTMIYKRAETLAPQGVAPDHGSPW